MRQRAAGSGALVLGSTPEQGRHAEHLKTADDGHSNFPRHEQPGSLRGLSWVIHSEAQEG